MAAERAPIAPSLIAWARAHGRHDLPWQHPPTPYRVWVSEIMLQQTQVATVIPYFERFMTRFPTLAALADAELSEVLALWSGLGYYARARNLHAAARRCREAHGGRPKPTTGFETPSPLTGEGWGEGDQLTVPLRGATPHPDLLPQGEKARETVLGPPRPPPENEGPPAFPNETANGAELPQTLDELTSLPGIGRSTAGAILALAHDLPLPILDGNAKRVLARYHAIPGWPGKNSVAQGLWLLAEKETPRQQAAAYTQAIMDLGATICTRAAPTCLHCPLSADCAAHATGCEAAFPGSRPNRPRPLRKRRYAWIEQAGKILFEERPPAGVWGGLLCLPELPDALRPETWCETTLGLHVRSCRELPGFRHEFTHFRLAARIVALSVEGETIRETGRYRWLPGDAALRSGLPAPIRVWLTTQQERQAA